MTSRVKGAGGWLLFSRGAAGVGRPRAAAPASNPTGAGGDAEWLGSTGSSSRGKVRRLEQHLAGGRWVQVGYALIDISCVVVNGLLAFFLRFSPMDQRHFFVSGHLGITTNQPLTHYGGFLLLYVALILLFCQGQDLYRTPRTRSASEESLAVVKAVFFATLLLAAFIYLSGVKIVSRFVVVSSFMLNAGMLVAWRYGSGRIVITRVRQ